MLNLKGSAIRWIWLAVAIMVIDQITKCTAVAYLEVYQSEYVLPFFNLTLAFNRGAAFSFLSDTGYANYFFIAFASIVSLVIVVMLARLESRKVLGALSLSLVLGGAMGNLIDRVRLGFVVDFLDFHAGAYHWPAFNIADSAICVGVILMFVDVFFSKDK